MFTIGDAVTVDLVTAATVAGIGTVAGQRSPVLVLDLAGRLVRFAGSDLYRIDARG